MKRIKTYLTVVLCIFAYAATAQFLTVKQDRTAILKDSPSGDGNIEGRLESGTVVKLLSSVPRYHSILTAEGKQAWSYKGNYREATESEAASFSGGDDGASPSSMLFDKSNLIIAFIDVEVGDATLIICPEEDGRQDVLLVDTGENDEDRIKAELAKYGLLDSERPITRTYISHHHYDHMGDVTELLPLMNTIYDHGDNGVKGYYKTAIEGSDAYRKTMTLNYFETFSGGVTVECVAVNNRTKNDPTRNPSSSKNGNSIALIVSFDDFDLFVAGDLEEHGEESLAKGVKDVDVYQVNHHGSRTSSTMDFIKAIKPEVSIASNGTNYGHPTKEVARRLINNVGSKFYQTNVNSGDDRAHNPDPKFVADDTYHGDNFDRENDEGAKGTIRIVVDPKSDQYFVLFPDMPLGEATFNIEK